MADKLNTNKLSLLLVCVLTLVVDCCDAYRTDDISYILSTWWGVWGVIGVGLIIVTCICARMCGSNPCYAGLGAFCCVYPCVCASCAVPCCIILCVTDKKSCDLCGKEIRMIEDDCDCFIGNHRDECLEENRSEFDSIPPSTLYKCKTCVKPLKVWPVEKLLKGECRACDEEYENDGTNVHVCFTCQRTTYTKYHLCNNHHGLQPGEMRQVNFEDKDSLRASIRDITEPSGTPTEPSAPPSYSGLSYIRQNSNPSTIVDLATGDMRYARGQIKRMVSREHPAPPTYEEAIADEDEEGGFNSPSINMYKV